MTPPARVWKGIAEQVAPAPRPAGVFADVRERLEALFALPRARLAVAAVAMVVFMVALIGYQRHSEERALSLYIEEGAAYLSQLGTNGANDVSDPYEVGNFYQGTSV